MRFELTTSTLARLRSTPELRPRKLVSIIREVTRFARNSSQVVKESKARFNFKSEFLHKIFNVLVPQTAVETLDYA